MAKFAKDDCRYTAKKNCAKHLFSVYPKLVKGTFFSGYNRKERRGIMARFRKVYGMGAFLAVKRKLSSGNGVKEVISSWIEIAIKDKNYRSRISNFIFGY